MTSRNAVPLNISGNGFPFKNDIIILSNKSGITPKYKNRHLRFVWQIFLIMLKIYTR